MANILIIFSAILNISSKVLNSYECLIAGRLLAGIFSGLSSSLLSLFLMEISPDNLRGFAGSMNQLTSIYK
jgi:MFS transporter, SP family, solute carrier family 2 (facilitated glucose transporter), member 4